MIAEVLVPESAEEATARFGDGAGVTVFGGGTRLDFVDPKNGWLMLVNSPVGYSTVGSTGPLYRTTDGGLSWAAVWPVGLRWKTSVRSA